MELKSYATILSLCGEEKRLRFVHPVNSREFNEEKDYILFVDKSIETNIDAIDSSLAKRYEDGCSFEILSFLVSSSRRLAATLVETESDFCEWVKKNFMFDECRFITIWIDEQSQKLLLALESSIKSLLGVDVFLCVNQLKSKTLQGQALILVGAYHN